MMQLNNNYFIHSLAGSGKTTRLVKYALKFKNKKIIITTYTNKNLNEIKKKFYEINGFIPSNINITTWYSFLLDECCRPYQKLMGVSERINNIFFPQSDPARFIPERDTKRHYFNKDGAIYSNKIAKFAFMCINKGLNVINRLEKITDYLFIDEAQDLSGFDFDILDKILTSNVKTIMVGDSRQNTFNTSNTNKNKKYANNIYVWFKQKHDENKGILKSMSICWRCNAQICSFADSIYPEFEKAVSKNTITTGHDGIFYVKKSNLQKYMEEYSPLILINNKRAKEQVPDFKTLNYGLSKGITTDRVLIVTTEPIRKYLKNGTKPNSRDKFYIAVTRARYSTAFLVEDNADLSKYHFSGFCEYTP